MEWNLSSSETIAAAFGINHFGNNNNNQSHQQSINYDVLGNIINKTLTDRISGSNTNVFDYENSITYRKKFKQEGRELELAYNATYGNNTNGYHQEQFPVGISKAFLDPIATIPERKMKSMSN